MKQKNIEQKKFKVYKMVIAMVLGAVVGGFVSAGNYFIPLVAVVAAFILMYSLKTRVKGVLTDERVEKISGKAAYATYMATAILATLGGIVLMALKDKYPAYLPVAYTLAFLSCGMIYLYAIIFRYYNRKEM